MGGAVLSEAAGALARLLVVTAPLFVAWSGAVGIGVWLSGHRRKAGMALAGAGLLELFRLSIVHVGAMLQLYLLGEGLMGMEAAWWLDVARSALSIALIIPSHGLLLAAIFGWRA